MLFSSGTSDLLPLVPLSARTVLDAGCGSGRLAAAYRPMNPKARLLGIDRDPAAAALAALHMNEVATVDLATDPLPFDVPDGIDCIIYSEILEHLRDPWGLLRRHAEALSPDGMMLICVPNIEYLAVCSAAFARRLEGRGNAASGLFGRSLPVQPGIDARASCRAGADPV